MSTEPAPSAARGDITLQPSYFTSSLFVNPLRQDIAKLVQAYAHAYLGATRRDFSADTSAGVGGSNGQEQQQEEPSGPSLQVDNASTVGPVNGADTVMSDAVPVTQPTTLSGDASSTGACVPPPPGSEQPPSTSPTLPSQPFALFKQLWDSQGWSWLHFKVLDARARESFVTVVSRLFSGNVVTVDPCTSLD